MNTWAARNSSWSVNIISSEVKCGPWNAKVGWQVAYRDLKRSLMLRYATCQPTWAFQGPHETSETMMWADHELFWAAHVFIEDRRRSIERISRFKLLLSFDRPENGSISTLNRFLCLLNRSQKPWNIFLRKAPLIEVHVYCILVRFRNPIFKKWVVEMSLQIVRTRALISGGGGSSSSSSSSKNNPNV